MVRTPREVGALWIELPLPARQAVGLCLLAGLRAEEAFRAESGWLRRRDREIWAPIVKTGEWNRTALVDTLADILPTEGPLVTASRNTVKDMLVRASARVGLSPAYSGPGAFRHHCATWAIDAGYTEADVKLILSHATGSVTARYIHSQSIGRKRAILETVEKLLLEQL